MSTMAITAADVNKLRQITGAGMMDCKKALTEANGDFDAAIDYLRKQGQKVAAKRADRDASEGLVLANTTADGTKGVLVCVNCETDFVADVSACHALSAPYVFAYNHPGNKVASLVALNKTGFDGIAKDVAMQVAAMGPIALDKASTPQSVIDKELEIGKELAIQEGKPAEMAETP